MRFRRQLVALWMSLLPLLAAAATPYPTRQIQIVTSSAPGGSMDVLMRLLAKRMTEEMGQPVVVLNKPGGGGLVAVNHVASMAPDGYTFLFTQMGALAISPAINGQDLSLLDRFEPVTQISTLAISLAVNASLPIHNLAELVEFAKTRGRPLHYATAGNQFSLTYLYSVLFAQQAGIAPGFVPYKLSTQALTDLVSGQIDMMFDAVIPQYPEIQAGRIRSIALFGKTRSALLPDVPTAVEQGYGQVVQGEGWYGLLAPAGTSGAIVDAVHRTLAGILQEPEVRARIGQFDMTVSGMPPAEFKAVLHADARRWAKLIRDNHIAKGE
ncbi:tripartite tricarboxylate transporter substrate binding protein [Pigmentiphaga sp. YJ18]|uniref:Bug family tripartite tricarboxylate transporter substrate binding protein n=1 Tax=unclassified Pigmentiphaga TaxID=2626614 RepID=UPI001375A9CC|nr:tripartite tricarboxylate transporter substrate binding protein [Pigmentiphaga sp. H8]